MGDEVKEMGEKKSTQSWTISDELGEEIKDEVPKRSGIHKNTLSILGPGTQADAGAESAGGDILCAANGLSMEGIATGVRQRQHGTQNVSKMAGSGIF